jgi:spore coat polysaccharide biosynthesis protein SpsF
MPILGEPLLQLLAKRVAAVRSIDTIVVATTVKPSDDRLAELVESIPAVVLFRGSEENVLERFYDAALASGADVIMRITADNPFFDWALAEHILEFFSRHAFDYVSTPGYPYGIGQEVFSMPALAKARNEAIDPFEREHVTPYFYRHPELFSLGQLSCEADLSHLRLTVDTPDDLARARTLFGQFGEKVTYRDVVDAG